MNDQRITYLLRRYMDDELTILELNELQEILLNNNTVNAVEESFQDIIQSYSQTVAYNREDWEHLYQRVLTAEVKAAAPGLASTHSDSQATPSARRVHLLRTAWLRYAAAVILLLAGAGTWLYLNQTTTTDISLRSSTGKPEILPGGNKAILTLADGSVIVLDSASIGNLAQQGNTKIIKLDAGALAYNNAGGPASLTGEVMYNTISTPRGGQFTIILQDGTKVWLNAASSLKYPSSFTGADRKIEVSGEAFFQIAKDKTKPFLVKINDQAEVKVLGTSFNVYAYRDEEIIRTTLLEGSIRMQATEKSFSATEPLTLKPGQQAKLLVGENVSDQRLRLSDGVNIAQVMAWKNGVFNFEGARFEEVMRQLERWYDITVIYEKEIPYLHFEGDISRNITLTDLLKGLELSGVRFRVEDGRRLVVLSATNQ